MAARRPAPRTGSARHDWRLVLLVFAAGCELRRLMRLARLLPLFAGPSWRFDFVYRFSRPLDAAACLTARARGTARAAVLRRDLASASSALFATRLHAALPPPCAGRRALRGAAPAFVRTGARGSNSNPIEPIRTSAARRPGPLSGKAREHSSSRWPSICEKSVVPESSCDFRAGKVICQQTIEIEQIRKLLAKAHRLLRDVRVAIARRQGCVPDAQADG